MGESFDANEQEWQAIDTRRDAAGIDKRLPRWGLALSGGGIRSATFCLGLIRALAARGVLRRFDYLSTVSGGGYAGSALGRLYQPGTGVDRIEQGLADDGSLLLWWLRSNGRFLIPKGMGDLLQASASHLRGFIATQFETAVLSLILAGVILLPHLLLHTFGLPLVAHEWLQGGGTLWWALLPLPAFVASAAVFAYWFSRDEREAGGWRDLILSVLLLLGGIGLILRLMQQREGVPGDQYQITVLGAFAGLLLSAPVGYAWRALRRLGFKVSGADDRIVFTGKLADAMAAALAVLAFGLLDIGSWLAAWLWLREDDLSLSGGAGLAALLLGVARSALPALQKARAPGGAPLPLDRIGHYIGLAALALLVLMWLTLMQSLVFLADGDGPALQATLGIYADSAAARWLALAAALGGFLIVSKGNLEQLNRSSLHAFYRSRLARAYVSTGNHAEAPNAHEPRFPASPLSRNRRELTEATHKVTRMMRGDDVRLADYRPQDSGGPVHLVNCCINQTRDDRTGSFNADRKGVSLTVSSLGLEVGTHGPQASPALADTPLSQWIAVSGAAVSSGMGSLTQSGIAALLFLSGLRLGYWWRRDGDRRFGKYPAVLAELLARFPGLRSPAWYLSDGGHFDNTGVYALLKRRLPLIVLADCGADPGYLFADLESLVRKARIDYSAQIEFIDPASIPDAARTHFGTPDSIGPEPGDPCLLLARIRYADGGEPGALLVIKPRRLQRLPLDLTGYADRDPLFPQQATGDQFFDEAQWESYNALGKLIGGHLDGALLEQLPAWVAQAATRDLGAVASKEVPAEQAPSRRARVASTVGTSLGIGALASVLIAGWQVWDEHKKAQAEQQRAFIDASSRAAEKIAAELPEGRFSPELRLRLDALLALSGEAAQGRSPRQQSLETLAASLDALCGKLAPAQADASACLSYSAGLRGQQNEEGPLQRALTQYWIGPARPMPPPPIATLPPPAGAALPAPPEAAGDEPAPPPPPPSPSLPQLKPMSELLTIAACSAPGKKSGRLTLYIHIYDEKQRDLARGIADRAIGAGLAVPGIENVVANAQRKGSAQPLRWLGPTWLYRGDDGRRCAEAARDWLREGSAGVQMESRVVKLPDSLKAAPGIIELWLPPVR